MIRLRQLNIHQAPGLPDGVAVSSLEPGLNLVLGPNASGKSTLVRVLLGTLWPDGGLGEVLAEVVLDDGGREHRATLRFGSVRWEPDPPNLPPAEVRPLLALDLRSLLERSQADTAFSRRLAVELMAGYDLDAALKRLKATAPRTGELQKELKAARGELRELERRAEDLVRQESRLAELSDQRDAARGASGLADLAEKAARLAGVRAEIGELRTRLDALPPGLERLHGGEIEELERMQTALKAAGRRVEDLTTRLRRTRQRTAELSLPGRHPAPHEVAAWQERVRELVAHERKLADLGEQAAGTRAELEDAARALGSWQAPPDRLPADVLATLEGALQRRKELQSRVQELEAAAKSWESWAGTAHGTDADRLIRGIDALRSWLRTAPVERVPAWPGWAAVGLGAVLVLLRWVPMGPPPLPPVVAGWLLAVGPLLLGAGGGFLAALSLVRRGAGARSFADTQRRAAEAGLEPEAWEQAAVRRRLDRAEGERDELLAARKAAQRAADTRLALEQARQDLEAARDGVRELTTSLGLADELPELALMEAAGRVRHWVEARDALAGLEGRIAAARDALRQGLDELGAWLEELGLPGVPDADGAAAMVEELAGRLKELDRLTEEIARGEEDLQSARRELDGAGEALHGFWKRVGIDPPDTVELHRRLEALPEHRDLENSLREKRAIAATIESDLGREDAWERLNLDPETFTEQQARELAQRHADEGGRYEGIVAEIKEIEAAIGQAEGGSSLEEARARVAEAARAIAAHRDAAMETVLARFLVERAREAQRREHTPRVLQRAQERFSTFTRQAFRLTVDGDGTLSAVDTRTGARRSLEELSDGTRIHLLLAARLAAIEEAEGAAGPLPLLLDEALSTTDPRRFGEIAGALLELVRDGRQILYLTADPAEAAHWRRACEEAGLDEPPLLHLGPPPERAAGWASGLSLDAGTLPEVPPPDGLDAVAWAERLGIPAPDPWRPAGAWHLLHLLPDRLETVHRLLQLGFSEVGPLTAALESGALDGVLDPADRALLRARACLLEAALALRGEGRGRPVTWKDVEASGAVSAKYEEAVKQLVESHGRDPRAFLAAVGALRGFRRGKLDELEEHLAAAGILPTGDPLPDELVDLRATDRCRPAFEAAGIDTVEATAYVRSLLSLLER